MFENYQTIDESINEPTLMEVQLEGDQPRVIVGAADAGAMVPVGTDAGARDNTAYGAPLMGRRTPTRRAPLEFPEPPSR